jgi:hypothetical protein
MRTAPARPRPVSLPTIQITGLSVGPTLKARALGRLRRALAGVRTSPVRARVDFADVNGPKGGRDIRCAIDVQVPRTAPFHVEAIAERDVTAFDRSAAALARQIAQRLRRRQDASRRPKKYFVARRLL